MGVSYRPGVADTRHSPSATFVREALARGARRALPRPAGAALARARQSEVEADLPSAARASTRSCSPWPHAGYRALDLARWLGDERPAVLDANAVLTRRRSGRSCGASAAASRASDGASGSETRADHRRRRLHRSPSRARDWSRRATRSTSSTTSRAAVSTTDLAELRRPRRSALLRLDLLDAGALDDLDRRLRPRRPPRRGGRRRARARQPLSGPCATTSR